MRHKKDANPKPLNFMDLLNPVGVRQYSAATPGATRASRCLPRASSFNPVGVRASRAQLNERKSRPQFCSSPKRVPYGTKKDADTRPLKIYFQKLSFKLSKNVGRFSRARNSEPDSKTYPEGVASISPGFATRSARTLGFDAREAPTRWRGRHRRRRDNPRYRR